MPKSSSSHSSRRDGQACGRAHHRNRRSDNLHAEPLNSVHEKEVAGYKDEIIRLIEEKVIIVDTGEEIIFMHGTQALSMYSDRTHMNIPRRCWPDWWKNRRRYVRRLGYAPERIGMLLTASDGHVCHEEQVGQTLSAKAVKDLIWLLSYVPPDLELQLGRANAVFERIHQMLNLEHWSIDEDDEELGDVDDQGLGRRVPGR